MCQTGVAHNRCNDRTAQTFGAYATRRVFDNLLMDFRFVLRPITHN
jgi:hypothetical protein